MHIGETLIICIAPTDNKSHLVTFSKLSRSKPYTLVNLFTETQHLFHEQTLGDIGEKENCFLIGSNLSYWTQWQAAICFNRLR